MRAKGLLDIDLELERQVETQIAALEHADTDDASARLKDDANYSR